MTIWRALSILIVLGGIYVVLLFALTFTEVRGERKMDRDRTRGKW